MRDPALNEVENFSDVPATPPPPPPPPVTAPPEFLSTPYVFELTAGRDGSAAPVALGAVEATDPDGGSVEYELTAGGAGRFAVDPGTGAVTYVGPGEGPDGPGLYRLTVQATDSDGETASAAVEVRVVNGPPTAVDDTARTDEDTPVAVAVLDNDSDPDGDPLTVTEVSDPAHGAARLNTAGAVQYTPAPHLPGARATSPTCRPCDAGGRPSSCWPSADRPAAAAPPRGAAGRCGDSSTRRRSRASGRLRRATKATSAPPTWASTPASASVGLPAWR